MHPVGPEEPGRKLATKGKATYRILMLLVCSIAIVANSTAQEEKADTTETIYEKIERFSNKRKVTRWIHSNIFVEPEPEKKPPAPALPSRRVNPYERYAGRIIRKIEIDVSDPFGHSVEDTVQRRVNTIQKFGNILHRKTRPVIIRDLLLVEPNDKLDPLKITESERMLRASPAISDARIIVVPVGLKKDSVDLVVRTLDRWTIGVGADGDLGSANGRITERNLLGMGQELEQRLILRYEDQAMQWIGHHRIYNISNTYIASHINYQLTETANVAGISLTRPFYSPLTLWAGGFSANKSWIKIPVNTLEPGPTTYDRLEPVNMDSWLAHSFPLERHGAESGRLSSLVLGARLATTRFHAKPTSFVDREGVYLANTLFLVGLGLSQRQFYKDRYLFRFGLTEDVPEGFLLRFMAGMQKRERYANMPYLGAELARGRNYSGIGYFSYEVSYGTFIDSKDLFDATFRAGFTYFTELITLGKWHVRQFVRAYSVMGFAKPSFRRLTLNVPTMYGFESPSSFGDHRTILNFETVAYAPWDLIGFRIAPVLLIGFGVLDDEQEPYLSGKMHSSFTLGILIRNERLLMNTFEVALSFYPFIPEEDGALWRHNAFTNFATGTRGFSFTSPQIIAYN